MGISCSPIDSIVILKGPSMRKKKEKPKFVQLVLTEEQHDYLRRKAGIALSRSVVSYVKSMILPARLVK